MKRWNGWGNVDTDYPMPLPAIAFLTKGLDQLQLIPDSAKETLLSAVLESRLPAHPLVDISAETRLTHSRGQSLPDWIALRYGRIAAFPDGVAFPRTEQDIRDLMTYAHKVGAHVIPYGGGTSVVGHINPLKSDAPVLKLSLEKMTRLLDLDETSHIATFQAGVAGPQLEAQLRARGYILGHFPQSWEYSTLGGWIATRSSGQQSYHYGRIEQLFAGGRMETPRGTLELPHFPASAAGPDLREKVLGAEGRLGVITQAKVRMRRVPEAESFYGVFFPSWGQGTDAVRSIIQNEVPVSILRLSNPLETETTLILSGKTWIDLADRGLRAIGYGDARCLLIFAVTGSAALVHRTRRDVTALCRKFGGLFVGKIVGRAWEKSRFRSPFLRNTLWEAGLALDTVETALPWSQVMGASRSLPQSIVEAMKSHNESVLAFAHLSHVYRDGASVYSTFLFRRSVDPDELLHRWGDMKRAASLAIRTRASDARHFIHAPQRWPPCLCPAVGRPGRVWHDRCESWPSASD